MSALARPGLAAGARRRSVELVVRVMVVVALGVDAAVHFQLADAMQIAAPGGIGGGTLFRLQAMAAVVAAVILLVTGSRLGYVVGGLVAFAALGAVLLYSFVAMPQLGPIPSMYDPTWSTAKVSSAAAELVAVVLSVAGTCLAGAGRGGRAVGRTPGGRPEQA